jgi:hypothetical protein
VRHILERPHGNGPGAFLQNPRNCVQDFGKAARLSPDTCGNPMLPHPGPKLDPDQIVCQGDDDVRSWVAAAPSAPGHAPTATFDRRIQVSPRPQASGKRNAFPGGTRRSTHLRGDRRRVAPERRLVPWRSSRKKVRGPLFSGRTSATGRAWTNARPLRTVALGATAAVRASSTDGC